MRSKAEHAMKCPQCDAEGLDTGAVSCPQCGFAFPRLNDTAALHTENLEETIRRQLVREFKVERLLGKGGMSLVYLAREPELSRQVAVKVLPLQLSFDESAIDRFKREAKIAASLDHPHIVPVFRVGATPAFLWYSMKYVKGRSLAEVIQQAGPLDLESTLDVVEQVAGALNYAHRRGVIHRDIKPSNIMLDQDGWVTVCDFGVAKAFGSLPLTQTGRALGTPAYMSPEQCFGKTLDGRSDQYALAALTFECLAGRPPFVAQSVGEYVQLHCTADPPKLTELNAEAAESVSEAIDKALRKDPKERFADVIDFVKAIGGRIGRRPLPAITAEPVDHTGPTTPVTIPPATESGRVPTRRRAKRVGAYAAVGVALIAVALALPTRQPTINPESQAGTQAETFAQSPSGGTENAPVPQPTEGDAGTTATHNEPEPPAAVRLYLSTTPLGTLFIDGRRVGPSFQNGIPIDPGRHTLRVELDGYAPYENTIEVVPGQRDIRLTRIELRRQ
jgi:predicted Ser/Thr protein kinase